MSSPQYEALLANRCWTSYNGDSGDGTTLCQINSSPFIIKALQSLLPLLFALSLPCLGEFTSRVLLWYHARRHAQEIAQWDNISAGDGETSSQSTSLPPIGSISNRRILPNLSSPNNATGPDKPNVKTSWLWWLTAVPLWVAWLTLGLWLSMLSTSEEFLVSSSKCGLTSLSDTATYAQYLQDQQYQAARERIAAEEVELCYSPDSLVDQAMCNLLNVAVKRNQPCQFDEDPGLCQGVNSTIVLQMDWTSIRKLGYNAKEDVVFQHTVTCSPLDVSHPRLIAEPLDSMKLSWLHSYYYGPVDGLYSTFQLISTVYNFKERYATFAADVLSLTRHAKYDRDWNPDPGLRHDVNKSLTLIFASRPPDLHEFKSDPSANLIEASELPLPLACVEHQVFCNSDKTKCYSTVKSDYPAADFELISQVMQRSSLADAVRYSGGRSVLRDPNLGHGESNAAADDPDYDPNPDFDSKHWARALERQFKTSIAMLHNTMREFALGMGETDDGYVVDDRLKDFCGSYKVRLRSAGVLACRIWWWLLFAMLPLLLFIWTRKWELPERVKESLPRSLGQRVDEWGLLDSDVSYWFDDRCLVIWVVAVEPCIWASGKVQAARRRQANKGGGRGAIALP